MTVHRVKTCSCGHDESWHEGGTGACIYGHEHVMGGCDCQGFSRRRRSAAIAPAHSETAAPDVFAAIDLTVRALLELRSALASIDVLTDLASSSPQAVPAMWAKPVPARREKADKPEKKNVVAADDWKPGKCETALLSALAARHPKHASLAQIAGLSGYSPKSSSLHNGMSALRKHMLITGDRNALSLTALGVSMTADLPRLPTSRRELVSAWAARLDKASRAIFEAVARAHPEALTREELAQASSYSITSSSFHNALSTLRGLELVSRGNPITLGRALEGAR